MPSEMLLVEPGHTAFALVGKRALIQIRSGAMTHAILDRCESQVFPRFLAAERPVGALIVLNGDAEVQAAAVRARQQATVGKLLDDTGAFMVSVVEGSTIQASSLRTVSRVLVLGKRRLVHRPDVGSAAEWLSQQLDLPVADLVSGIAEVREALRQATGGTS